MTDLSVLADRAAALLDAHHQAKPVVLPTVWD
ncbi:isocitrate lyase/phosphoenolpyruvate mutase family protein, partial [Geobacillus sp. MMMUD3]|nr:isocitrate lyase/phosphoenolpyruvate mutase family protein [Geobacillus sp. MMMUD3]